MASALKDGRPILQCVFDLANERLQLRSMPLMKVVFFEDQIYSLNNRFWCFYRLCEQLGFITQRAPIKVELLEALPANFDAKFTTCCRGEWVRVRGDGRICGRTLEETTFGRAELQGRLTVHYYASLG